VVTRLLTEGPLNRDSIRSKRFISSPKHPDCCLRPECILFSVKWDIFHRGQSVCGAKLTTLPHLMPSLIRNRDAGIHSKQSRFYVYILYS
jgi:hypothetical protein